MRSSLARVSEAKIHERKVKTRTPSKTALRFLRARKDAPSSVVRDVISTGCDQSQLSIPQEELERLNRARDFFGDCVKRWDDWLTLMRVPKGEAVSEGRLALIYHFRVSTKGIKRIAIEVDLAQATAERGIGEQNGKFKDDIVLVLHTNAYNRYHGEVWNRQLMLVNLICLVNGPEPKVPLLVGLLSCREQSHERS
jgi:hypothetical protein